jgi:hypothetical protein
VIHLPAYDARLLLEALDDAEQHRRNLSRDCPCRDGCEECDDHTRQADNYADLAGIIFDGLDTEGDDRYVPPNVGPRPAGRFSRAIEIVPTGGLL